MRYAQKFFLWGPGFAVLNAILLLTIRSKKGKISKGHLLEKCGKPVARHFQCKERKIWHTSVLVICSSRAVI